MERSLLQLQLFFLSFFFLEELSLIDGNNPVDLYIIHLLFLPVIQRQLNLFKDGWANHSLRTEGNRTPLQLWILGLSQAESHNPRSLEASSVQEVSFVHFACKLVLD